MTKRQTYTLDPAESAALDRLVAWPGFAWIFWRGVCERRGLDYRSVIAGNARDTFTALPEGHRQHWCYPRPLKCKTPAEAA